MGEVARAEPSTMHSFQHEVCVCTTICVDTLHGRTSSSTSLSSSLSTTSLLHCHLAICKLVAAATVYKWKSMRARWKGEKGRSSFNFFSLYIFAGSQRRRRRRRITLTPRVRVTTDARAWKKACNTLSSPWPRVFQTIKYDNNNNFVDFNFLMRLPLLTSLERPVRLSPSFNGTVKSSSTKDKLWFWSIFLSFFLHSIWQLILIELFSS